MFAMIRSKYGCTLGTWSPARLIRIAHICIIVRLPNVLLLLHSLLQSIQECIEWIQLLLLLIITLFRMWYLKSIVRLTIIDNRELLSLKTCNWTVLLTYVRQAYQHKYFTSTLTARVMHKLFICVTSRVWHGVIDCVNTEEDTKCVICVWVKGLCPYRTQLPTVSSLIICWIIWFMNGFINIHLFYLRKFHIKCNLLVFLLY
jgi:hypothetical protein